MAEREPSKGPPRGGQSSAAERGRLALVPEELGRARLDACVKALFELSWNEARRAISTGKVSRDGVALSDGASVPGTGAVLRFDANAPRPRETVALSVVYEDE